MSRLLNAGFFQRTRRFAPATERILGVDRGLVVNDRPSVECGGKIERRTHRHESIVARGGVEI